MTWWRCTPMPRWNWSELLPEHPLPASASFNGSCKYLSVSNKLPLPGLDRGSASACLPPAQATASKGSPCSGSKHVLGTGCNHERDGHCAVQGGHSLGGGGRVSHKGQFYSKRQRLGCCRATPRQGL